MRNLKDMTRDEKSLLLYLETRAVDHNGRVNNEWRLLRFAVERARESL